MSQISRRLPEKDEHDFYLRRAPQEWLEALALLGTDEDKEYLEAASYRIAVFAQTYGLTPSSGKVKNYHVTESVAIATGMQVTAVPVAGLASLTHTCSPMGFLIRFLGSASIVSNDEQIVNFDISEDIIINAVMDPRIEEHTSGIRIRQLKSDEAKRVMDNEVPLLGALGESQVYTDVGHRVLRGIETILQHRPMLVKLSQNAGLSGEMDNLSYFLTTRDGARKRPCLVLIRAAAGCVTPCVEGFSGAALLSEYQAGFDTRIYTNSDSTGRRNVLAAPEDRAWTAAVACRLLIERGAKIVSVTFLQPRSVDSALSKIGQVLPARVAGQPRRGQWSVIERDIPLYLPLGQTFDATLACIGQKTRANLRYYRRRAVAQLGCTFVPEVSLTLAEFLEFNRLSTFAVPEHVAVERYASFNTLYQPFLSGIRAADGRWLSLTGGRWRDNAMEIDWQMNRHDLPGASLATVMRSFLISYAIDRGLPRLYIEGGTPQAIRHSFVTQQVAELIVSRQSIYTWLIKRLAPRIFPANRLASQLAKPDLRWHTW